MLSNRMFKLLSNSAKYLNVRNEVKCAISSVRGKYNRLSDTHVNEFEKILGPNGVLRDDIEGFNTDWLNTHKG